MRSLPRQRHLPLLFLLSGGALLSACGPQTAAPADSGVDTGANTDAGVCLDRFAPSVLATPAIPADGPDPRMGQGVVYELQVRTANACDPRLGSVAQQEACRARVAPRWRTRALDATCADSSLQAIRPGTLDDLMVPTDDPADGISLRWIAQGVGADTIWLMPPFPNNDRRRLPEDCDVWGSPYAVRDYFHVRGSLAAACVVQGVDEYGDPIGTEAPSGDGTAAAPCWGDQTFEAMLQAAADEGLQVWLDVAFNHFGHDYLAYDLQGYTDVVTLLQRADARRPQAALAALQDFDATFDPALTNPVVLERTRQLPQDPTTQAAWDDVQAACENWEAWRDDERVRATVAWRLALPWERATFACDDLRLEATAPGFYLGADARRPSRGPGDDFTRDWRDVKFLYLREDADTSAPLDTSTGLSQALLTRLRNREYLTRVLLYWSSRGVAGYRLDHASGSLSGLGPEDWQYMLGKVAYYEQRRGAARPLILAEEFHAQEATAAIADAMTEGWLFDMAGRGGVQKNSAWAEGVLQRMQRHRQRVRVMTALENHDELRLSDGTGLDPWSGLGFWALGAATWSMPMLLVGQEFGASRRLQFRKPSVIPERFEGAPGWREDRLALAAAYRQVIQARAQLPALHGTGQRALRRADGRVNEGVVTLARWDDAGNHAIVLHNLWAQALPVQVALTEPLAAGLGLDACTRYRLVDVFGRSPGSGCRTGRAWADGVTFFMTGEQRFVWATLQACEDD